MSTLTPNLSLTKPAGGEAADIAVINANMDIIDNAATLTGSQTLTNKTLTSPHMTTPVVDSGGLTVTAGGLTITAGGLTVTAGGETITAGNLGIGAAAGASYGINLAATVTVSGGQGVGISNSPTLVAAANNDAIYVELSQPALNANSKTGVAIYGKYLSLGTITNFGQATTSAYGQRIVSPTGGAVDNIGLWLSGTPSGGTNNQNLQVDGPVRLTTLAARAVGDVYVIMDANGNLHKSAVGPAS